MEASARTAVEQCMNVESGEEVLVVTDEVRRDIKHALEGVASEITQTVYVEIPADEDHGKEPPASVAEAMRASDVVFAPTTRSLTHTQARVEACETDTRVATMPSITEEIMQGAMRADYSEIRRDAEKLLEDLEGSTEVGISAEGGTDLTMEIPAREWHPDTGICDEPGCVTNLPAGEVYVAPESGEGRLVVDGSMAGIGKVDDPIEIYFEDGRATRISDDELREIVDSAGECGRNLAELGIGLNPSATLIGNVLQDEKVRGTVHVAVGDDSGFGGDVECEIHLDGVVKNATVEVDGRRVSA